MEILQENGRKGRGKQIHRSKTFTRKCCHEMLRNCQILAMKNRKHEKKEGVERENLMKHLPPCGRVLKEMMRHQMLRTELAECLKTVKHSVNQWFSSLAAY